MLACVASYRRAFSPSALSIRTATARPLLLSAPRQQCVWSTNDVRGYASRRPSKAPKPKREKPSSKSPEKSAGEKFQTQQDSKKKSVKLPWMAKAREGVAAAPDPLRAAQHVAQMLAKSKYEEAGIFTREASKRAQVVVAWNNMIDYSLKNQRLREALKLFQEMKKRSQVPNAQTYTILLRGFAISQHPKIAVSEAVKLYQSMLTRERVKPNVIHLNAVITVCAKAGDLESLFTVIETANDSLRSPNGQTYTIILNSLRASMDEPGIRENDEQLQEAGDVAVKETLHRAKTIWREVITRWRAGTVVIDEALVCSMGRLLQRGDYNDQKSVLDLVEQTMQISPNQAIESGTSPKETNPDGQSGKSGMKSKSLSVSESASKKSELGSSMAFAKPGNNSLSLVLEILASTRRTSPTLHYWESFVELKGVVPDAQNWTALLYALHKGRNSTKAAMYLAKMPKDIVQAKHVRTVLKACLRDLLNPHAFENATKVLDTMKSRLSIPDTLSMQTYLHVAYACKKQFEDQPGMTPKRIGYTHGRQLAAALGNLYEPFTALRKHIDGLKLDEITDNKEWLQKAAILGDAVALARKMIATSDRLIFESMVPEEVAQNLKPHRNLLNHYVVAYFEERLKRDPGFDRRSMDSEPGQYDYGLPETWSRDAKERGGKRHEPSKMIEEEGEKEEEWEEEGEGDAPQEEAPSMEPVSRKGKYFSGVRRITFGEEQAPAKDEQPSWLLKLRKEMKNRAAEEDREYEPSRSRSSRSEPAGLMSSRSVSSGFEPSSPRSSRSAPARAGTSDSESLGFGFSRSRSLRSDAARFASSRSRRSRSESPGSRSSRSGSSRSKTSRSKPSRTPSTTNITSTAEFLARA